MGTTILLFAAVRIVATALLELLVGLWKLDVAGAALATVLAQLVSVILSAAIIRKQKLPISFSPGQCRIYAGELKKILNIGVPIAVREAMVQISFLVINSIVNHMGLMPSAGYGIAQKIISFIMLVPSSVMQSVSAFVAQNIGAGLKERAWKGFLTAMAAGGAVGVVIFGAGFWGGSALSSVFTSDREVIAQSAAYLKGFSADCILTRVLFGSIGSVMIQGISSAFRIRIPVSIFMSRLPDASLMLVGMATPVTTIYGILFFAVFLGRLKRQEERNTSSPCP